MAERFAFTKTSLAKFIEHNPGKRIIAYDHRQPGLMVELRAGGSLSFYFYAWAQGRPCRVRIGAFPNITVDTARKQAREYLADVAKGIDPAAVKRQKRQEPTLDALFEHWMEQHAKKHKRTWQEDQRLFGKHLAQWKNRRLSTIAKPDVQAWHSRVGRDSGPYEANRVLALLRAMFNKADDIGYQGANPTRGVKKFKEQSRDRFLQPEEVPAFFKALAAEDQLFQDFFMLCLLTGARRGNVVSMSWADVHLDGAVWRIPDSKHGDPIFVHLPDKAVEILRRRKAEAEPGYPWVFPGGKRNRAEHLKSPKTAWDRIRKNAGLPDLRIHDLRRTLGSWQAIAGSSLNVIGASLGHKSIQSTAVYARLTQAPVAQSVNQATTALLEAAEPAETEKGSGPNSNGKPKSKSTPKRRAK